MMDRYNGKEKKEENLKKRGGSKPDLGIIWKIGTGSYIIKALHFRNKFVQIIISIIIKITAVGE